MSAPTALAPPAASARTTLWRARAARLARVALAVLPLVWIGRSQRWDDVARRAAHAGFGPFLAAFAFVLLCLALGAVRWQMLLRAYGAAAPPPVRTLLGYSLIGTYFNLTPGGVAGDAVRGYRVRNHVAGLATSYAVLLVDRVAGLVGLLVLALGAALVGPPLAVPFLAEAMAVAAALGLVLAALALGLPWLLARRPALQTQLARVPWLGARLATVQPMRRPALLAAAVVVSVGTQAAVSLSVLTLVTALAPQADALACFRVVPLVVLLMFVPITPGGVGQREAVFLQLFSLAGVPAPAAIAASLLSFAVGVTTAVLGGLCLLWEGAARRRERAPSRKA